MSKFYYIDEQTKQQCGPFSPSELTKKGIRQDTMVWRPGMGDWQKAETIQELGFLFNNKMPVPQEQPKTNYNNNQYTNPTQQQQQQYNRNADNAYSDYQRWNGILPMPKSWLLESILLTIFCCSPISLVGIFYASRVESLYYKQDFEGATHASKRAKVWTLSGIFFWPGIYFFFFLLGMIMAILGIR